MKDQIEKNVVYSGNEKKVLKNLETKVSSHNDNRWPEGLASGECFRKTVVRLKIWAKLRDPEPSVL